MPGTDGRDKGAALGGTFDRASALYQRARPDYPRALIDTVIEIAGSVLAMSCWRLVVRPARRPCPSHVAAFGSPASSPAPIWPLLPEETLRRMKT